MVYVRMKLVHWLCAVINRQTQTFAVSGFAGLFTA